MRLIATLLVALPLYAQGYDVFAIRYATVPQFPVSSLMKGADKSEKLDIAMMVWLIRGNGRDVVVDFMRPDEAVAQAGVKPDEVTDVVLTHAHWDHADGADLFSKAQIWIQKAEYTYYTGEAWQKGGKHGGIEPEDMQFLLRANIEGRLHLVDGDQEILPGIRVYIGGKHTYESQYVAVDAKPGPIVLASDNAYLYAVIEKHVPISQTLDEASNLKAQDKMRTLVKDPRFIVPGHDPAVMTKYTKVNERVTKIE